MEDPQGGVAIVVPIKYEVTGKRTVIPGLCVEATVMRRGDPTRTTWVVRSLYLPPDDRRAASEAYVDDRQRHEGPVYVGCDLIMQTRRPRSDDEQDDTVRMCDEWQRRGSSPVIQGKDKEGRKEEGGAGLHHRG